MSWINISLEAIILGLQCEKKEMKSRILKMLFQTVGLADQFTRTIEVVHLHL